MLLDSSPVAVSGALDPFVPPDCRGREFHDPGGWGIVRFDNGVRAHVEASPGVKLPFGFRIVGDLGWIDVHAESADVHMWTGPARTITSPPDRLSSLAIAVDEIAAYLSGGPEVCATDEGARQALEVIMGFHVSSKLSGRWVSLPLAGDHRDLEVKMG
jgi:hypothetical protein